MDLTEVVTGLLTALIGVLVPVIVAYLSYWAKRALKALEVRRYAEALREYDAALYEAVADAARLAVKRAADSTDVSFLEGQVTRYVTNQAVEISRVFSEKAGVKVDLTEQRVETLVGLAISEARKAARAETQKPL